MLDETYREVWKRGQTIFDQTVQGKIVDPKDFERRELVFYNFRVDNFDDLKDMLDKARETFNKEHLAIDSAYEWLKDMTQNNTLRENWWQLHESSKRYWKEFCEEKDGNASYSYGNRMINQIQPLIEKIKRNKYSTGAQIIVSRETDISTVGRRIPCTTSFHFICRPTVPGDKLNLIINQRSADAINFFPLDFAKGVLLLQYISEKVGIPVGYVIQSIDSLHVYARDVPESYRW